MVEQGFTPERLMLLKSILHDCVMGSKDILQQNREARDNCLASGDKLGAGKHDAFCLKLKGMLEAYEFCQASIFKIEKGEFDAK